MGDLEDDVLDVVLEEDCISWHLVGDGGEIVVEIVDLVEVVVVARVGGEVYD